jgi:iron complex transport system ATP-binding protein
MARGGSMKVVQAMESHAVGWRAAGLTYRYQGADKMAVEGVSTIIRPGVITAILGPNGSGKSTLLKLLLGVLSPNRGEIELADRGLGDWSRQDVAKMVGVVPQDEEISFPISVRQFVAMGRYPHLGAFRSERNEDRLAIEHAMDRCDIADLRDREITTLSGGERQRARLARALAQEPRVLALDEPTRALDVRHEMQIFEILRGLVRDRGVTVLLVTHNLNLASRYADELLLMDRGRIVASGAPAEVLRRENLEPVYQWALETFPHPGPGRDAGAVQVAALAPSDEKSPGNRNSQKKSLE